MADQKTEDTKPAAARRGVRPFIGPAGGAAGGAAGARPVLKPAGLPVRHAPFAPPLAPDRASLGTPRPEPRSAQPAPPIPTLHPTTQAPSFDITVASAAPAEPVVSEILDASTFATTDVAASLAAPVVDDTDFGFAPAAAIEETVATSAPEPAWAPPAETRNPRSITSEMVAIDAFAAFDSVWGPSTTPVASPAIDAAAPHVDEEALGRGADGHHAWAEDITAGSEAEPPTTMDAVSSPEPDVMSMQWTPGSTAAIAMPSWLADDADDVAPAAVVEAAAPDVAEGVDAFEPAAEAFGTPDDVSALVAPLDEPLITTTDLTTTDLTADLSVETLAAAEVVAGPVVATEVQPMLGHGAAPDTRVVAALDRLAERVRAGEIDVSSVAPDAPDAAVLASVLAALLGGSRSR